MRPILRGTKILYCFPAPSVKVTVCVLKLHDIVRNKQIKPKIFAGKRRYYDAKTIEILKKIKFLLKEKGMTINGVKKYLLNKNSFDLDEFSHISINSKNNNLKSQIEKISKLVKEIKKLG